MHEIAIPGIATLGFFIDSAPADIRLVHAVFLIVIMVIFIVGVDSLPQLIRTRLRLSTQGVQT